MVILLNKNLTLIFAIVFLWITIIRPLNFTDLTVGSKNSGTKGGTTAGIGSAITTGDSLKGGTTTGSSTAGIGTIVKSKTYTS